MVQIGRALIVGDGVGVTLFGIDAKLCNDPEPRETHSRNPIHRAR